MKKIGLTILSLLFVFNGFSQVVYNLTLEESIEIAKEKSYRMLQLEQDMKIAEYNLQSTTSRLKTHITLNLTLPDYSEEIRSKADSASRFYTIKELSYKGNLRINQPLPTDGSIYIQSNLSAYRDYNDNIKTSNFNTKLGFSQPLDILYGYSQIRTDLKNAKLEYERSSKSYKRNELNLISSVSRSYYNLLSLQKQTEIAALNLERQNEAYEISKNKFEAGLIREVDALQMEVDLAEAQSNYDLAVFNQLSSTNSFKEMIGVELNDSIILNSQLTYQVVTIDPDFAVELALKNRTEIRERDIQIEQSKMSIKAQQIKGLPRGSIEAFYGLTGIGSAGADEKMFDSVDRAFARLKDEGQSFGVGFTVSVPILDFGENRALVRAAKARLKNSEYQKEMTKREIENNVRTLAFSISSNLKRLQLLEKNLAVAEKSFATTRLRYSDGDIDSQTLALERNRLNNAHTSYLSAYIQYQLSLTQLMEETLYDFLNETGIE
ncbi:outer membrane protein [Dysgonomonadaceae bacterium PH5-43]|nr:outer membrane protein [Dysgonomonadaceae bacterium PH5-43]